MDITLAYFSPTGTTRRVLASIARGMEGKSVTHLDLTLPETEPRARLTLSGGLTVLGAPVYAGRIPAAAVARFCHLQGHRTPAALVVVYGNRAFEDALVELADIAVARGCVPLAGAAFIGEHSYATAETPIATGRPDTEDLARAQAFGRAVWAALESVKTLDGLSPPEFPGNRPYRQGMRPSEVCPVTYEELCTRCGDCARVCPVGAVTLTDSVYTDGADCILCCACVKACPTGARVMADEGIRRTARWLATDHTERRDPELFLPLQPPTQSKN